MQYDVIFTTAKTMKKSSSKSRLCIRICDPILVTTDILPRTTKTTSVATIECRLLSEKWSSCAWVSLEAIFTALAVLDSFCIGAAVSIQNDVLSLRPVLCEVRYFSLYVGQY